MQSWATRIKIRMKDLDLTQEELAGKMGITRGAITHYLSGRRVPPLKQFQKLAAVLKADPSWLQFGTPTGKTSAKSEIRTKEKSQPAHHALPILTWAQAAELTDVSKLKRDEINEWMPHFYTDKPRWYALRVKGDSMASIQGQKSYHEGDIIIVDPDKTAKHGDMVIVILPKAKEATFKQYVVDGGMVYLKPLNPQYPLLQIDKKAHVCGVMVFCVT